jgi:hypothetical protein
MLNEFYLNNSVGQFFSKNPDESVVPLKILLLEKFFSNY